MFKIIKEIHSGNQYHTRQRGTRALLMRLGTWVNDRHCIVGFFQTEIIATAFLADRTNGRAYGTTLCVSATCAKFPLKYFVFFNIFITYTCCFKKECGRIGHCIWLEGGHCPPRSGSVPDPKKKCMLPGSTVGYPSDSRVSYCLLYTSPSPRD